MTLPPPPQKLLISGLASASTSPFNGAVTTDFGGTDYANDLILQKNGQIVAIGYSQLTGFPYSVFTSLARYNASNGSLDKSFDSDGKLATVGDQVYAGLEQADGKLVVVSELGLVRYNADGSLDSSFGSGGKLTTKISMGDIAQQADGKLVLVGYIYNKNIAQDVAAVFRYNIDGSIDTTFGGGDGVTSINSVLSDAGALLSKILVQADGKLLAVYSDYDYGIRMIRYNTNGSLDKTFGGGDGVLDESSRIWNEASTTLLQKDGKILWVGSYDLMRYNSDGSVDISFGVDGIVSLRSGDSLGYCATLQNDGKIVVAMYDRHSYILFLARYNSNGSLDNTFTGEPVSDVYNVSDLVIAADGKFLVSSSNGDFLLLRFNSNGSLDSSFNAQNQSPTGSVTITGQALQGETLTASHTLADADGLGAITYTWKTGSTVLATGASYTLTNKDAAKTITVTASYTDSNGTAESVTSAATVPVVKLITGDKTSASEDVLQGSAGADLIKGLALSDDLLGGGGNDSIFGGTGDDSLYGEAGNDVLAGEDGDDFLSGDAGNDSLDGGNGNDILSGSTGADVLLGGAGNDMLLGASGNDTLSGGLGTDTLFGGAGQDIFQFFGGSGAGVDTVIGLSLYPRISRNCRVFQFSF